jgi:hypothetical protein
MDSAHDIILSRLIESGDMIDFDQFAREECSPCVDRVGHTRPACDDPCQELLESWEEYKLDCISNSINYNFGT